MSDNKAPAPAPATNTEAQNIQAQAKKEDNATVAKDAGPKQEAKAAPTPTPEQTPTPKDEGPSWTHLMAFLMGLALKPEPRPTPRPQHEEQSLLSSIITLLVQLLQAMLQGEAAKCGCSQEKQNAITVAPTKNGKELAIQGPVDVIKAIMPAIPTALAQCATSAANQLGQAFGITATNQATGEQILSTNARPANAPVQSTEIQLRSATPTLGKKDGE